MASSLLNTGQQVGGAIGLAALGTVTWTAVSNSVKHQVAQAAAAGHALPAKAGGTAPPAVLHQALAVGISRGFLVAAGIAVLALIITVAMIRVRRAVTRAYSAATKKPLSSTRSPTPINSRVSVTPRPPKTGRVRRY